VGNRFYRAVAERITAVREQHGLRQEDVARRTGMNRSYIARVEAGAENLSLQTLSRFAIGIGVNPSVFLDGLEADPEALKGTRRGGSRETGPGD
jgi:transcriptional regulator with XRE-family HTH domain